MIKIIKRIFNFFSEHWFLRLLLFSIPTIWSILISFFPVSTLFKNNNGQITFTGIATCAFLLMVTLLINVLSGTSLQKKETEYLLDKYRLAMDSIINNSTSKICENKRLTLAKYAKLKTMNKKRLNSPFDFMFPKKQMAYITEEIAFLIKEMTNLSSNDILVTIAYTFIGDFEESWQWIESTDLSGCATLETLLKHPNSTFYKIKDKGNYLLFFNSKKEAERENKYYFDNRDIQEQNTGHDGSVICKSIEASYNEQVFARAVLSISSFRKQFVTSNEKEDIDRFSDNLSSLIDPMAKRIQIELLNLYIKYLETNNDED